MTSPTSKSSWNDLKKRLSNIKPAISTFSICDDLDLREQLAVAKREVRDAEAAWTTAADEVADMVKKRLERARARLDDAQAAFDTHAVTLRFKALSREELEALEREHPATEEQEADGEAWNPDTFPPALIAAASLDGMPVEDAREYMAKWPNPDFRDLWNAAYGIQTLRRTDLGKG